MLSIFLSLHWNSQHLSPLFSTPPQLPSSVYCRSILFTCLFPSNSVPRPQFWTSSCGRSPVTSWLSPCLRPCPIVDHGTALHLKNIFQVSNHVILLLKVLHWLLRVSGRESPALNSVGRAFHAPIPVFLAPFLSQDGFFLISLCRNSKLFTVTFSPFRCFHTPQHYIFVPFLYREMSSSILSPGKHYPCFKTCNRCYITFFLLKRIEISRLSIPPEDQMTQCPLEINIIEAVIAASSHQMPSHHLLSCFRSHRKRGNSESAGQ